jgi:hypothetical protein
MYRWMLFQSPTIVRRYKDFNQLEHGKGLERNSWILSCIKYVGRIYIESQSSILKFLVGRTV